MIVARKLALTAVLAAVLALAPFMSMTAKAAPGLGQARLTNYATAQQPANITETRTCTTGSSSGNVTTCLTTYHDGRYVEQMKISACVNSSARTLFVAIGGPQGPIVTNPQAGYYIVPGSCDILPWNPFATVPAGKYTGYTYRVTSLPGSLEYTLIGEESITL